MKGPLALLLAALATSAAAGELPSIAAATLGERGADTPEVSTDDLAALLASGRAAVLDVRSAREYAIAHIPGSVNVWEKEVDTVEARYPDRATTLVLYCNGPFCGKSRRTSAELVKRGYTNVRRYQLGLPVWRALGNTVQTDVEGLRYIVGGDRTAVLVDARSPGATPAIPGAVRVARGEAEAANEDGRLPHRDKGTRVIVFGSSLQEARAVAEEIARKAYWNSSYFGATPADLAAAVKQAGLRPPYDP